MKYIKGLDTVRAFAVTLVLLGHYIPRDNINSFQGKLEQFFFPSNYFGVTLFFVLSGYLITNILIRSKQENDNKLIVIKKFIIRRSLRIFPIYYLLLLILLLIRFEFTPGELPYLFTYTSNLFMFKTMKWSSLGHTWSLSVEEQFYLIWPWIIIFTNDKYLKYVFISFISIGIISSFIVSQIYLSPYNSPAGALTTSCFDSFGIGGIYAYFTNIKGKEIFISGMVKKAFLIALGISLYWKLCPYLNITGSSLFLFRTIDSLLALGIIHYSISAKSILIRRYILENKFLNLIGKVSYGMYLYHYPMNRYFRQGIFYLNSHFPNFSILNNTFFVFIVKFTIVLIVSYLSFELIEKRILKLKARFGYPGEAKLVAESINTKL